VEILRIAKPHEVTYKPHMERSLRRSLRKMINAQVVVALGRGGPGDPHRYAVHPMLAAMLMPQAEPDQKATPVSPLTSE
jgi:hypothetical protein